MADDESLKDEMTALLRAAREREPVSVGAPEPEPTPAPGAEEPPARGGLLRKLFR